MVVKPVYPGRRRPDFFAGIRIGLEERRLPVEIVPWPSFCEKGKQVSHEVIWYFIHAVWAM
jgi:hypothetical protein